MKDSDLEGPFLIYQAGKIEVQKTLDETRLQEDVAIASMYATGMMAGIVKWLVRNTPNGNGLKFTLTQLELLVQVANETENEDAARQ